ncbi:hypothetical protein HanPI659440_Chr04g0151811 [Helianthus annuus]|nr:hypothetical protein HanPI659440_Chr04g0151811 [Helianthus annuus]
MLFFLRASISVSIAFFHSSELNASCVVDGICSEHKAAVNALASLDKFPVAMFATGYLDLGVTFSGEYLLGGTPLFSLGGREYLPVVSAVPSSTCSVTGSTSSTTGSTCSTLGSTCSVGSVVVGSVCSPVVSKSQDIVNLEFSLFLTSGIMLDGLFSVVLCSADCVVVFEDD